ncbi:MAG: DsbA family protein [Hyphomicrobiales bacterium]|nr:DsbA family protein [Hyphomicrobiales bacterium]OQW84522.1 MAG: disulfide bond formation protein DsbA [Proteobacteria bacterium ST_bin15]
MVLAASGLALAGGADMRVADGRLDVVRSAHAAGIDAAELNKPGPLGDKVLGAETAKVTIIEYASMTCPHCAAFHTETLPKLKEKYIDTGLVKLIFREFPLDPLAAGASILARCAPGDRYFPMIDVLYRLQRNWAAANDPVAALLQIARQTGFTQESFEACLRNQSLLDGVNAERDRASRRFGVSSTPTLFINGQVYRGALSFDELDKIVGPMVAG